MSVMIVEDDTFVQAALVKLLTREGYEVMAASDALSAIDLALRRQPDIVISDWNLDGAMSGVDLLRILQSELPDCRLIMITGNSVDELRSLSHGLRLEAIVAKPFYAREILSLIEDPDP